MFRANLQDATRVENDDAHALMQVMSEFSHVRGADRRLRVFLAMSRCLDPDHHRRLLLLMIEDALGRTKNFGERQLLASAVLGAINAGVWPGRKK